MFDMSNKLIKLAKCVYKLKLLRHTCIYIYDIRASVYNCRATRCIRDYNVQWNLSWRPPINDGQQFRFTCTGVI